MTDKQARGRFWFAIAILALPVAGIAAYAAWNDPSKTGIDLPCYFNRLTGLYCPGCGATRALHELLHGRFLSALHENLFAVVFLPVTAYLIVGDIYAYYFHKKLPTLFSVRTWAVIITVTGIAFTVLRNIPVEPFTWLAP